MGVVGVIKASRRELLVLIACGGLVLAGAPAAGAAADTSPPVWSKRPATTVAVGAELNTVVGDCAQSWLPVTISWKASDPQSGIDHYGIGNQDEPVDVGLQTKTASAVFTDSAPCGGGRQSSQFYAYNGAGLAAPMVDWSAERLLVVQDDGSQDGPGTRPSVVGPTYAGAWSPSAFTGWSGGTTRKTTAPGAAATLTVGKDGYDDLYTVAVVMPKGPDRGQAAVYVDGVRKATVNTYSATRIHRKVVWRLALTLGTHQVRVVNLATAGHPRIDVDAFLLIRKNAQVGVR